MSYDDYVKETLEQNHLFRHLFARLNQGVIVNADGEHIRGILKTIDLRNNYIEIDAIEPAKKTFFVNMRKCIYIETEQKAFE